MKRTMIAALALTFVSTLCAGSADARPWRPWSPAPAHVTVRIRAERWVAPGVVVTAPAAHVWQVQVLDGLGHFEVIAVNAVSSNDAKETARSLFLAHGHGGHGSLSILDCRFIY